MQFAESSHRSRWLFSPERLLEVRQALHGSSAAQVRSRLNSSGQALDEDALLSMEEEQKLLRFYLEQIPQVGVERSKV